MIRTPPTPADFKHFSIKPPPVDLAVAKDHLQITDNLHDADISSKLQQASDYVTDYLQDGSDLTWTSATLPAVVQAAMLEMLAYLYDDRGPDNPTERGREIWQRLDRLLFTYRDPTIA